MEGRTANFLKFAKLATECGAELEQICKTCGRLEGRANLQNLHKCADPTPPLVFTSRFEIQ